ncbi:MAG: DUF1887 family CARF protein [Desulfobacterales bacterium]
MKTCLVSLVSDQTIPNILVATELKPDYLLLISTASMEKKQKSRAILDTLLSLGMDYNKNSKILNIVEDSISDFYEKVVGWHTTNKQSYDFTVNLTCGTKIMALSAYEFFKAYDAKIVYMPIPRNFYFPIHHPNSKVPIKHRLSVEAYLSSYGVAVSNQDKLAKIKNDATQRYQTTMFLYDQYKELFPLLQTIGKKLRQLKEKDFKNGYEFSLNYSFRNQSEEKLMTDLGYSYQNSVISKKIYKTDWNYLRGGWLEERVFKAIESILPLNSDILMNVCCKARGTENEYDVLFTLDNVLYVVECKSLDAPEGRNPEIKGNINEFLYKLGALRQDFGITPKGILATTSSDILTQKKELKPHIIKRGNQFNTTIAPLLIIKDLEDYFEKLLFDNLKRSSQNGNID